jgi:hypothetical protein
MICCGPNCANTPAFRVLLIFWPDTPFGVGYAEVDPGVCICHKHRQGAGREVITDAHLEKIAAPELTDFLGAPLGGEFEVEFREIARKHS